MIKNDYGKRYSICRKGKDKYYNETIFIVEVSKNKGFGFLFERKDNGCGHKNSYITIGLYYSITIII